MLTITLPVPANIANGRMHWAAKSRKQKAYRLRCTVMHPSRPERPIEKAHITAAWYVWNTMDDDNAVARLKWPIDWLVARGIILNDDPAHMTLGEVTQEIDRREPRLVLTVREANAD
jgi:hypothetical protein